MLQKREDMTERDWRIFREDFSIAYKGAAMGPNSLPIRNWKEANLPDKLMRSIERLVRPHLSICFLWLPSCSSRCRSAALTASS